MYLIVKKLIFLLITLLVCASAFAQKDTGRISGTIKDAKTKKPLNEAVISVKSEVFEGQKFAITDSSGVYKINNLPPGEYVISFEMEGYQKFSQEKINLKDGTALKVDYEMAKDGYKKRREVARKE